MRHLKSTVALVLVIGCAHIAAQAQQTCQGIVISNRGTRYCVTTAKGANKSSVYTYTNMANGDKVYMTSRGVNADGTPIYVQCNENGSSPVTSAPAPETNAATAIVQ